MRILWTYLKPHLGLVALALLLAAVSQVLALIDPIIFGWTVDGYAIDRGDKSDEELVSGVLGLLGLAVLVAVTSCAAKAFQDYTTRFVPIPRSGGCRSRRRRSSRSRWPR